MNKFLTSAAMAMALSGVAASANAEIITWTLDDVTFSDGATASGFFDYDTATGAAASFDLETTAGGTLGALHYTTANAQFYVKDYFSSGSLLWVLNDFSRYINLAFAGPLTTPGTVALRPGALAGNGSDLSGSWECTNCSTIRDIIGGSVTTAAAVPEPATWAMMLMGFGALGAVLRRRHELAPAA